MNNTNPPSRAVAIVAMARRRTVAKLRLRVHPPKQSFCGGRAGRLYEFRWGTIILLYISYCVIILAERIY